MLRQGRKWTINRNVIIQLMKEILCHSLMQNVILSFGATHLIIYDIEPEPVITTTIATVTLQGRWFKNPLTVHFVGYLKIFIKVLKPTYHFLFKFENEIIQLFTDKLHKPLTGLG